MILVILTSHRADCFSLCVDCLERHTDLGKFERIFVMGNAPEPEHWRLANSFVSRHPNAALITFGPRGLKSTMLALDGLLAQHTDQAMVKLDEDVFVTPGWLEGLTRAYRRNKNTGCGLVSALVPNNDVGQAALHDYLCAAWPTYAHSTVLHGKGTSTNAAYAVWIWTLFLNGKLNLADAAARGYVQQQRIATYLNINCILLGPEFLASALPFSADYDESRINLVLRHPNTPFYGLLAPESVAHHYSFRAQQQEVDAHVDLAEVRRVLLG